MKNYIDLHMHSMYSDDGEFTPKQLVDKCVAAGMKVMSIADHNSVKANDEAKEYCKEVGLEYIPAIEIDCTHKGLNLHMVGYGMDYHASAIQALEENVFTQELACSNKKLELTNEMGFSLTKEDMDEVSHNGVWTGEMFGEVILEKEEYKDHPLLVEYRPGGSRSDNPFVNFYWDFYAQGKPCYTEIVFPSLQEAIDLVHAHGGKCVLAHPGNNLKADFTIIDEMIALGLDGIEAFSSYHGEDAITYFYDKTKQYNLLATSGSDYHGKTKPAISVGGSKCNIDHDETYAKLKELKLI